MAAETLTGLRAASTYPVQTQGAGAGLYPVWGYYAKDSNALEADDVFVMCRTPVNFLLLGGHLAMDDIDTGTATLDMDLGWSANGGGTETYTTSWGADVHQCRRNCRPRRSVEQRRHERNRRH